MLGGSTVASWSAIAVREALGQGPHEGPMTQRMSLTTCAPSRGWVGWSVATIVSAPWMSTWSSSLLLLPRPAWQRVAERQWRPMGARSATEAQPSSSRVCAAPSLWSLPGRWHATAFGVSLSSLCPGRPSATVMTGRHSARKFARTRGCSTCRTWPSSQTSCATTCTPPSPPSPRTPKRPAGVRLRAGDRGVSDGRAAVRWCDSV